MRRSSAPALGWTSKDEHRPPLGGLLSGPTQTPLFSAIGTYVMSMPFATQAFASAGSLALNAAWQVIQEGSSGMPMIEAKYTCA